MEAEAEVEAGRVGSGWVGSGWVGPGWVRLGWVGSWCWRWRAGVGGQRSNNQQCGGSWNRGVGGDKHVMKLGGGGLIVIIKLSNFNHDTALMPINTHLTDVELMMTCIIKAISPFRRELVDIELAALRIHIFFQNLAT